VQDEQPGLVDLQASMTRSLLGADAQGVDPEPGQRGGQRPWPVIERRYQAAFEGFAAGAGAWLQIRRHHGLDGAARVYREVLTDASYPAEGHVVELTG
jgi:hypothetical protein